MQQHKQHRNVALIEVADEMVLTEIENDSFLQPFLGERVSPHCVIVQAQAIPDIVRRLQALGHMPQIEDAGKACQLPEEL